MAKLKVASPKKPKRVEPKRKEKLAVLIAASVRMTDKDSEKPRHQDPRTRLLARRRRLLARGPRPPPLCRDKGREGGRRHHYC